MKQYIKPTLVTAEPAYLLTALNGDQFIIMPGDEIPTNGKMERGYMVYEEDEKYWIDEDTFDSLYISNEEAGFIYPDPVEEEVTEDETDFDLDEADTLEVIAFVLHESGK